MFWNFKKPFFSTVQSIFVLISGNLSINFEKYSEGLFSLNFAFQVVSFDFSFCTEGFSHWHRYVRNTLSELLCDTWEILGGVYK